ncbi:GMC family oxidoreductase [Rhizobium cauense]|uniref:GMC oxidoreductase n=1 Tax=Rhizobium cauense TaxID=1166683 RepID=UPI001C6E2A94|nr:GMC oxidoreductase [Rhizobium cauense]MBW9117336.1 GMC family oxidoreductase [Rhizobium cauense]
MLGNLGGVPENWCQVCVVGAGPVGLALAISLANKGLRVLLLESGRSSRNLQAQALSQLASLNPEYHGHSDATVVRAVGGSTLRWGGRCVELDDIDFDEREHVSEGKWPIGHGEIRPYYSAARSFLTAEIDLLPVKNEVSDFDVSLETWARIKNTAHANRSVIATLHDLVVVSECTILALNVERERGRILSLDCIKHGARHKLTAPAFVLSAGGRENARLLLEAQCTHPQLFCGDSGPLGRYYMGHLTGEISAIRFASSHLAERHFFKTSPTGTVYRHRLKPSKDVQRHRHLLNIAFWPDSPTPDEVLNGNGAGSLLHLIRHAASKSCRTAPKPHSLTQEALKAHFKNAFADPWQTIVGGVGMARRRLTPANGPRTVHISPSNTYVMRYHSEQLAAAHNRVSLSHKRDEYGCRRLNVDFNFATEDFASVIRAHDAMNDWLIRTGFGTMTYLRPMETMEQWVREQAVDGYHQIGLTRMSSKANTGIVNENCRVHDLENLYIAGSSVFPTSGQANPTLPAVALAMRLADHLATVV